MGYVYVKSTTHFPLTNIYTSFSYMSITYSNINLHTWSLRNVWCHLRLHRLLLLLWRRAKNQTIWTHDWSRWGSRWGSRGRAHWNQRGRGGHTCTLTVTSTDRSRGQWRANGACRPWCVLHWHTTRLHTWSGWHTQLHLRGRSWSSCP